MTLADARRIAEELADELEGPLRDRALALIETLRYLQGYAMDANMSADALRFALMRHRAILLGMTGGKHGDRE